VNESWARPITHRVRGATPKRRNGRCIGFRHSLAWWFEGREGKAQGPASFCECFVAESDYFLNNASNTPKNSGDALRWTRRCSCRLSMLTISCAKKIESNHGFLVGSEIHGCCMHKKSSCIKKPTTEVFMLLKMIQWSICGCLKETPYDSIASCIEIILICLWIIFMFDYCVKLFIY
jgi:hypothetical protein